MLESDSLNRLHSDSRPLNGSFSCGALRTIPKSLGENASRSLEHPILELAPKSPHGPDFYETYADDTTVHAEVDIPDVTRALRMAVDDFHKADEIGGPETFYRKVLREALWQAGRKLRVFH